MVFLRHFRFLLAHQLLNFFLRLLDQWRDECAHLPGILTPFITTVNLDQLIEVFIENLFTRNNLFQRIGLV